jgi:hypothetical protein
MPKCKVAFPTRPNVRLYALYRRSWNSLNELTEHVVGVEKISNVYVAKEANVCYHEAHKERPGAALAFITSTGVGLPRFCYKSLIQVVVGWLDDEVFA